MPVKQYYLPPGDNERSEWLHRFATHLPNYAGKYGISAAQLADMAAGADFLAAFLEYRDACIRHSKALTSLRDEIYTGDAATLSLPPQPTAPLPPAGLLPGIIQRAGAIAGAIKRHKDYVHSDGLELGLEGAEAAQPAATDMPKLKLVMTPSGHPQVRWKKGPYDAIEIDRSVAGGPWTFATIDMRPHFTDAALELPPAGTAVIVRYRAIYRKADRQIGQWSDVVSCAVGG